MRSIYKDFKKNPLMNTPETTLLFVYGSLRKHGSHNHLLQDVPSVGSFYTYGFLYLIDWYPGLILNMQTDIDKKVQKVYGDVYRVTPEQMKKLDKYEGETYHREWISVFDDHEQSIQAQTYIYNQSVENKKEIIPADWILFFLEHVKSIPPKRD